MYDALKDRKSILISASNRTDEIGFLKSLVFECISPEEKILFLRYMEDISSYNNVENVFINEIWTDGNMSDLYLNKIANKRYRWLIISLHSSLEVFTDEKEINKVKELVDIGILSQEEFDAKKTRNSRPINGAFMQLETVDNEGNAGATRTKWCSGLRTGLFNPFRYFGDSALVRAAVREHQVSDDAGGGSTGQCAGDDGKSLHRRAERGLARCGSL